MKKIFFLAFLSLPVLLKSQTTVKGIITEQNSGNKPIVGVQIKVLGANPEVSDNSGLFQLVFGAKKPGDRVIVSEIKKKGYEIVNKKEVDGWLIGTNPNQRTKIVMCTEGLIAENTAKYYDISLKAVTDGYNKQIKELQEQLAKAQIDAKTYGEQAKSLSDQFANQQNQLEELADKFARENFDDCSTIQRQAFEAFKQGNIEEAIRILETVDSDAEIAKAKQQKARGEDLMNIGNSMKCQADSIIQQNISKLMMQARLYETNMRFKEADEFYEKSVREDSFNVENLWDYTDYLGRQKQYNKALRYYQVMESLLKFDFDKIDLFVNIGVLYTNQNQFNLAEKYFNQARELNEQFKNFNTDKYNLNLINIDLDLGILNFKLKRLDIAEDYYLKCMDLLDKLSDKNTPENRERRIVLLNNLGGIQVYKSDFNKGISYCLSALKSTNYFSNADTSYVYGKWPMILGNLALNYSNLGNIDSALFYHKLENSVLKKLIKKNPQIYLSDLARNYYNIAIAYFFEGKLQLSEDNFKKSADVRYSLMTNDSLTYMPETAETLNNLGFIEYSMQEFESAEKNYLKAELFNHKLFKQYPDAFLTELARTTQNLADLYFKWRKYEKAEYSYKVVLNYYERIPSELIVQFNTYRLNSFRNLSFINLLKRDFSEAERYSTKGLEFDNNNALLKCSLANSLLLQGKFDNALVYYKELSKDSSSKDLMIQNFNDLEQAGIITQDITKIRKLLSL